MTAQRLVRGSKTRNIITVCCIFCFVGVIALLQNTQNNLEIVRKDFEACIMQQNSLSTQLQVIVDYKSKLEKSLQSEKSEHKQTRTELEARINDEKSRRDKSSMDANLRFTSLQQHYKLLQTKHDDLKEKSDKSQQQYLEETDKLQAKVRELQEQLKTTEKNKEAALEHLKNQFMQLQVDKENLQEQLKKSDGTHRDLENEVNHLMKENHQWQRKLDEMKNLKSQNTEASISPTQDYFQYVQKGNNFQRLSEASPGVYKIKFEEKPSSKAQNSENDHQQIQSPQNSNKLQQQQLNEETIMSPNENEKKTDEDNDTNLQKPGDENADMQLSDMFFNKPHMLESNNFKSSTKSNSPPNRNAGIAQPLAQPKVTSSTKKMRDVNENNVLNPPNMQIKIPPGVVPVQQDQKMNDKLDVKIDDKAIPDDINNIFPNRYRNNIIESEIVKEKIKETKVDKPKIALNDPHELDENGAGEILDHRNENNLMDFNHVDDMKNNINAINAILKKPILPPDNLKNKHHIDNLELGNNGEKPVYDGADYDKDDQKDNPQIDENDFEADDDDPDHYDVNAKHKDPAIRN